MLPQGGFDSTAELSRILAEILQLPDAQIPGRAHEGTCMHYE